MLPIGISGAGSDQKLALGIGFRLGHQISPRVSIGLRGIGLLQNWGLVPRYYDKQIFEGGPDDNGIVNFFHSLVGWGVAAGSGDVGWEVMITSNPRPSDGSGSSGAQPWFAFGSSIAGWSDGGNRIDGGDSHYVVGHAATFGVGYDFGIPGIALRTTIAPNTPLFPTSTGETMFNVLVSVEFSAYPDPIQPKPVER